MLRVSQLVSWWGKQDDSCTTAKFKELKVNNIFQNHYFWHFSATMKVLLVTTYDRAYIMCLKYTENHAYMLSMMGVLDLPERLKGNDNAFMRL
jgi:hypothetical protein